MTSHGQKGGTVKRAKTDAGSDPWRLGQHPIREKKARTPEVPHVRFAAPRRTFLRHT